jgi:poly(3-hydroxybutyrate) depolymerase
MSRSANIKSSLTIPGVALAVLAGCLFFGGIEGIAERAAPSAASQIVPKPPESLNYSYKYSVNFFKAGADYAFMDDYMFALTVKPVAVEDTDALVALCDLERIYAPDFNVERSGNQFTVEHVGLRAEATLGEEVLTVSGHNVALSVAPRVIEGEICVPVASFMSGAFGKSTRARNGYVAVAHNQEEVGALNPRGDLAPRDHMLRGKDVGFLYHTYWFEEGKRTMNYRMYVPMTYDPSIPNKLLLLAHGASTNQNFWFTDTRESIRYYTPIETYAEKYGYIVAAPNAYIVGGGYGETAPYMGQGSMPQLSEEEKALRILSEKGFMLGLEAVRERFNIDSDQIYLMGNSMGGRGTFFLGNKYSEIFKAIVPCAMTVNVSAYGGNPYPNLVDKPVLLVFGTEDSNFDLARKNSQLLDDYLNDFSTNWNAGGGHSTSWARSLEQIFEFLNRHN